MARGERGQFDARHTRLDERDGGCGDHPSHGELAGTCRLANVSKGYATVPESCTPVIPGAFLSEPPLHNLVRLYKSIFR